MAVGIGVLVFVGCSLQRTYWWRRGVRRRIRGPPAFRAEQACPVGAGVVWWPPYWSGAACWWRGATIHQAGVGPNVLCPARLGIGIDDHRHVPTATASTAKGVQTFVGVFAPRPDDGRMWGPRRGWGGCRLRKTWARSPELAAAAVALGLVVADQECPSSAQLGAYGMLPPAARRLPQVCQSCGTLLDRVAGGTRLPG